MLKRKRQVKVYLDDKELDRFKQAVTKSGLSQAAFLRFLIKGYMPREKPPPEYYEILKAVRGACRNINQLTAVSHATGSIHVQHLDECLSALQSELMKIREATELPRKEI
jgi:hypothetical protein